MAADKILAQFERFLKIQKKSPRSVRAYMKDVHCFSSWFEESTGEAFSPASIVRRDMTDWRADLLGGHSPATVNRRMSSLRIFFTWAQREGLTSISPMVDLHGTRVKPAATPLPESKILALLSAVRQKGDARERAMLELLADTGMRAAELARVHHGELDLTAGTIAITIPALSGKKKRRLVISPRARLAVRAYLQSVGQSPPDALLFSTRRRTPLSSYVIWYLLRKYARLAQAGGISPRQLRAAAAWRLVNDPQVGLVKAAELLGHERPETLVRFLQIPISD